MRISSKENRTPFDQGLRLRHREESNQTADLKFNSMTGESRVLRAQG